MTKVTIPTASYVGRESTYSSAQDKFVSENMLLPELLPAAADFNQQCKLWRFYCTCLDLGCSGYRLEDFEGKGLSSRDRYQLWVKDWRMHYGDISNLIRLYKHARSETWFWSEDRANYRKRLENHYRVRFKIKNTVDNLDRMLYKYHNSLMFENLEKLRRSAQHLLNARFIGKLAAGALRAKNNEIIA